MTKTNTTNHHTEHRQRVVAIDVALTALEDALTAEQDFRTRVHKDDPEFDANCPPLKFTIKLSSNQHKPYQFISEWRSWARHCKWIKEAE